MRFCFSQSALVPDDMPVQVSVSECISGPLASVLCQPGLNQKFCSVAGSAIQIPL
jgi:hypothetical protein